MSKDDHWLNNSFVSRIARGPGFESRSGHDFFLPCDIQILFQNSYSIDFCTVEPLIYYQKKHHTHKEKKLSSSKFCYLVIKKKSQKFI